MSSPEPVDPGVPELRLLNPDLELPWYKTAIQNVHDVFKPPKLPPLEITSAPGDVQDIWKSNDFAPKHHELISGLSAVGLHVLAILLLLFVFRVTPAGQAIKKVVDIYFPSNLKPYVPPKERVGGGGGGQKSPTPVTKGAAPKFAPKQFMPPMPAVPKPTLPVAPTITAEAPKLEAPQYGDPLGKNLLGPPGLGNGTGSGLGNGSGSGYGPGSGGGMGGGVYRIGGGVSAPMILTKIEPEYSEEARKAKYQGTVVLMIVVDEHGLPKDIRVIKPLGLGLDEKAVEAVQRWRFRPGMKDGHAVATEATVEVNFRLL